MKTRHQKSMGMIIEREILFPAISSDRSTARVAAPLLSAHA